MAGARRRKRPAFARLKRLWRGLRRVFAWRPRRGRLFLALGFSCFALLGLAVLLRPGRAVRAYVAEELGLLRVEEHARAIERAAEESGVDPYFLAAIMFAESRGRVDALSHKEAMGLMQLSAAAASDAARRLGVSSPSRATLLSDANLNVRLGANHVAWLLDYRGDWSLEEVLVAYNAGRGKLQRWIEEAGGFDRWRARESAAIDAKKPHTGSLLYAERVLAVREEFRKRGVIRNPLGLDTR